jgi:hypothetical protein
MRRQTTLIVLLFFFAFSAVESNTQTRKDSGVFAAAAAKKKASNDERRKQVEAMLLRGEYHHDGSGELMYIGTMDSVPALLTVLQRHPGNDMTIHIWAATLPRGAGIIQAIRRRQIAPSPKNANAG